MAEIRHRVGVAAAPEKVYEALATREGLASWWTEDVRGEAGAGGRLSFYFGGGEPGAVMEVQAAEQPERVTWRCVEGARDWVGTSVDFELRPGDDETVLLFTHRDWSEPAEFMHHCSTKWGTFRLSLRDLLERARGTPAPRDVKIHVGD